MLGASFTVILRTFNEEKILPLVLENLSHCVNLICIDSGSTDNTLALLAKFGVKVYHIPWPNPSRVDPDWYQTVFALSTTDYILLVYCSHLYSADLLSELDVISSSRPDLDLIDIPYVHYMYNKPAPAFSTAPSLYGDIRLKSRSKYNHACSFFFNRRSLDFSLFRLHYEFPVRNFHGLRRIQTNNCLAVVRYEKYSSALMKEARYSSFDAEDTADSLSHGQILLNLITAYPFSFLSSYILKFGFKYGVPGFISSHLAASYRLSVAIGLWELKNNYCDVDSFLRFHGY
jgi:glycosyltransferase involved in cell wall biosynthesis